MKICLVSPNYPPMPWPCGAADFVAQYAGRLGADGHEVAVLTTNPRAEDQKNGVALQVIPGGWGWGHQRKMVGWLGSQGFDAVDLQFEAAMYRGSARPLLFPAAQLNRRHALVLTLHSQTLPGRIGRAARPLQILPYDAVVFYSEPFFNHMKRWFPQRAERFFLQGFPANITDCVSPIMKELIVKIKTGAVGSEALLVYFGHISPNRGIEDVLAALPVLEARGFKPQFVLMSQFAPGQIDYHTQLLNQVKGAGLAERVSFTGTLSAAQVSQMFAAADLCVLPFPDGASFKNGSLAAAIEHGLPTVTTQTPLTERDLLEPDALSVYTPGDQARLAELIAALLSDPARRLEARRRMAPLREKLSWGHYVAGRLTAYQAAVARRRNPT